MVEREETDVIELLTEDDQGHAVEGVKFPRKLGVVVYEAVESDDGTYEQRLAYPHKFFKSDERGQPMPGTFVQFLVPNYLHQGATPNLRALQLVEERMGWGPRAYR